MKNMSERETRLKVMEGLASASLLIREAIDSDKDFKTIKEASDKLLRNPDTFFEFAVEAKKQLDKVVSKEKQESIIRAMKASIILDDLIESKNVMDPEKLSDICIETTITTIQSEIIKPKQKTHIVSFLNGSLAAALKYEGDKNKQVCGCNCTGKEDKNEDFERANAIKKMLRDIFGDSTPDSAQTKKQKSESGSFFDDLNGEELGRFNLVRRNNTRECSQCGDYTKYVDCEAGRRLCSPECMEKSRG